MIDTILNFFYPPKCPFCRDILTVKMPVCEKCMNSIPIIRNSDKTCAVCGKPLEQFSHATCTNCKSHKIYFQHSFVPLIYKDSAKDAMMGLKYSYHPYYARAFAFLIYDKIINSDYYTQFDCVTFVPQNMKSKRDRGYNQSELIATHLAKHLTIPCISTLRRTGAGAPQHTLNAALRRENVKKCYFVKSGKKFDGGTVLLVDDIYTTGATANYCAKLLRQAGFEKVYLAVTMIRHDATETAEVRRDSHDEITNT